MRNRLVAEIFNAMADMLELRGENPFRVRAYRRAARTVDGQTKDVSEMEDKEILALPGIGKDLGEKIRQIAEKGRLDDYEEMKRGFPEGLAELLSVPGLGPKTAKLIYEKLKVKGIDDLERFAREHRLSRLPGIREKTEQNILKGIASLRKHAERTPLGMALPIAEEVVKLIRKTSPVKDVMLAGSIRRRKETVKDIDILCTSGSPGEVMDAFVSLPGVSDVIMKGPTKSSVLHQEGIQIDLRVVEQESLGSALAYFTGSKQHNIRLREMAVKAGMKINEYGVFKGRRRIGGQSEEDVYKALGLPLVPPELREDSGEIEAALEGSLPVLVELSDIRGDLHVHTHMSDGRHPVEELVEAARKRGYEYIAITDHSKGLGIARGLDARRLLGEIKIIDALNRKLKGFRVLKGVEVDIRSDLTLDFEDDVLKRLDIVVASIHSGFRQSSGKLTARIVAAMKNPYVNVIAHPTGRLIGEREAYEIDMNEVISQARKTGTALEINAYPFRLDLNDVHARAAGRMSVPVVINTDTHLVDQFDYMSYGVSTARRAWLEKKDVLNTLGVKGLLKALRK